MDLFCGTGTIAQLIGKHHEKTNVIGVDIVKSAIENAKINAQKTNFQRLILFAKMLVNFC